MFCSVRKVFFLIFLTSVTISFVLCSENDDVNVKTENLDVPSAEVAEERDAVQGALQLEHEVVNEQADQPTSGERFVAIHVHTIGTREELSPTLLGLTHLALTFLPAEYQFLTVISAAREVVAGVRFILVVNAEHVATGERIVCEMEILEKPWITTEWGDKWRMLERTNCTGTPNPLAPDMNQYNQVNPVFVDRPKEVTADRQMDIESQIITTTPRDFYEVHDTTTGLPLEGLSDEMRARLDAFFQSQRPTNSWTVVRQNVPAVNAMPKEEKIVPKTFNPETEEPVVVSTETIETASHFSLENQSTENPHYSEEDLGQQQIIDPFAQINPMYLPAPNDNVQEQIREKRELGVTEKDEILLLLNRALEQLDEIDEDTSRRLAIDIYHVKVSQDDAKNCKTVEAHAKVANSRCSEGDDENLRDCMENIFADTTKLCAIEATLCNDKSLKLKKTQCKPIPEKKSREKRTGLPGGISEIDLKDESHPIHALVKESLVSLGNTDNGDVYSFVRINSATQQMVAGKKYIANLSVKDSNAKEVKCDLEIWERLWMNPSKEIKFDCDNAKNYKFRSRRSIGDVRPQVLVGGPTPIDVENDDKVKDLVKNSLVSFNEKDGNSFELHRIVSATKKIVSGVMYDIKVEFRNSGDHKEILTCDLSVWERPWRKQDNSQTDVSCGEEKKYTFRAKRSLIYDHRARTDNNDDEEQRLMHQRDTLAKHEALFHKFQLKFGRAYHSSMEKSLRFRIFQNNLAKIQQLNEREQGTAKYGVTQFADMTPSEYRMRTGLWRRDADENHISNPLADVPNIKLPKSFDWRDKNAVSEVKNQGSCGSCWAFSVTGNIEGLYAIKNGNLQEFSEQELVDCDAIDGGCAGGLPDNAYKAIEELGGLEYESEYPYRARKGECVMNKTMTHVKVKGAVDLPKNETAMQQWLVANGPISIGINANAMQFYRGGVSHPWHPLCRKGSIDHGVLIVGYGVSEYPLFNKTLPYWIVKNSWGPKWGEQGYYRVFRGDNTCGVSEMASSAVLA